MNLDQIKHNYNRGQMTLEEIAWLIAEVERLQTVEQTYAALKKAL